MLTAPIGKIGVWEMVHVGAVAGIIAPAPSPGGAGIRGKSDEDQGKPARSREQCRKLFHWTFSFWLCPLQMCPVPPRRNLSTISESMRSACAFWVTAQQGNFDKAVWLERGLSSEVSVSVLAGQANSAMLPAMRRGEARLATIQFQDSGVDRARAAAPITTDNVPAIRAIRVWNLSARSSAGVSTERRCQIRGKLGGNPRH